MTSITSSLLVLAVFVTFVRTKPCDILESMSCECHSSSNGEFEQLTCHNRNNPIKTAIKLIANESKKQAARSFDSFHLTFFDHEMTVKSMFVNELSYLFPRSSSPLMGEKFKSRVKIILSFPNFVELNFEDYAFYQLFGEKADYTTVLSLELTSNGQVTFSSMAFHQLKVDEMFLHSSSLEPYSFEEIFNNTNIHQLTIEGLTPRSNETLRTSFNGKIQSGKFTKMVDTISSDEFPDYPVRALTIEAHEARRINASSFVNYRNLYGIHLIRPKFSFDNRSFDGLQYLTGLETIELDAETLRDHTFQDVSRIRELTLGENIRHLTEHSLDHLDYLIRFDASRVLLDQLYPASRCVLARYIKKQSKSNSATIILPLQAEHCDCIYDFILSVLNQKPAQSYVDLCSDNQQERCQLSECDAVKNFRIPSREQTSREREIPSIDAGPYYRVDYQRTTTHRLPSYVHRYPSVADQSPVEDEDSSMRSPHLAKQNTHLSPTKLTDPNAIPTDDDDETFRRPSGVDHPQAKTSVFDEQRRLELRKETHKWIALSLVCITILCILLVGTLIWFFTCRPSRRYNNAGFERVIPNSSIV